MGGFRARTYEASPLCKNPSIPPRLFGNRTSLIGYYLAFNFSLVLEWICIFLPVYFHGVLGTTPLEAGVDFLPTTFFMVPSTMVAGGVSSKMRKHKTLYRMSFGVPAIGCGFFTLLGSDSSKATWV